MSAKILFVINLVILIGVSIWFYISRDKNGYIVNQDVFNSFAGKKELEAKLSVVKKQHQTWIDSVTNLIETGGRTDLISTYRQNVEAYELQEQDLSQRYTAEIWKRLNTYIKEYGTEHNFTFIYGATGDGALMFASDARNITDEVIEYTNKRYKDGD